MALWPDSMYLLIAFASGSVPCSWILGRLRGIDIREEGSGNAGATNLLRICGTGLGLTGLFLDMLKGALPVLAATTGIPDLAPPANTLVISLAAISAVLGHVFSPWLGFRGGKGVATTLGVLLVLSPLSLAAGFVAFSLVLLITKYVSLGSICAAAVMIPAVFVFEKGETSIQIVISIIAVLIIFRHRSNIRKLLKGEENRLSFHGGRNE